MDLGTIVGISVALIGILFGQFLEGGSVLEMIQPTAGLIVFGGTIGATMIGFSLSAFKQAVGELVYVLKEEETQPNGVIDQIIAFTQKARREGIISLEKDADTVEDPFFKKSIMMAVDGSEPRELCDTMEMELGYIDERGETSAKIFEAAGGYAPTIGIIGAVLGLIHVMQNLDNIEEVGHGSAVAFVATIYGVGIANIFFLPAAAKLKAKHRKRMIIKEMMLEGTLGIWEGQNPRLIEGKLVSFLDEETQKMREKKAQKT